MDTEVGDVATVADDKSYFLFLVVVRATMPDTRRKDEREDLEGLRLFLRAEALLIPSSDLVPLSPVVVEVRFLISVEGDV